MLRSIWSKTLREYRVPLLSWGIGLCLLMAGILAAATPEVRNAYASVAQSFLFLEDPYALQTPEGYATSRYLELFVPILLSIWPILAGARMVRGEEERGSLDLLLATPQSRIRVLLEKILALISALLIVALLMALGTVAGEPSAHTQVDPGRALLTSLNLILLAFFFAMLALLISQFTTSRSGAAGWVGGLMVLTFLLDGTGRTVKGTWIQYLSPFYYYNLNRPLIASFNERPAAALVLLGLSLLFAGISTWLFVRRDCGRAVFTWQRKNGQHQQERSLRQAERDISVKAIGLRAFKAQGGGASWWLLGVVFWSAWLVLLIPTIQEPLKKSLRQVPALAKLFNGKDISTNAGFLNEFIFGIVIALVASYAMVLALNWASDLENGRLELVLSTPRSRVRMLLERFGAILVLTLLAPVLTWLSIVIGAQIVGLSIEQGHVIAASFSMLPPALIVIGLIYALAGRLRYSAVLGILSIYIILAFLGDYLKALLQLPDWLMAFSIFHLYGNPVIDGMDWSAFLGMSGAAVVLLVIGLMQFRRLDVERG